MKQEREAEILDAPPAVLARRRKRPDILADQIREAIVTTGLKTGDRVPADWISPEKLGVSRGTCREALKVLEFQGLVSSKTGPGGGIFVSQVSADDAIRLLDNFFLSDAPSISDIYALRKLLEPEIVADLAGELTPAQLVQLQAQIHLYEDEPTSAADEYRQRLAELDFHTGLARMSRNRLLGFVCTFLLSLLRDKTECRAIYLEPTPWWMRESGINYQVRLLKALKAGDKERARQLMREHMGEAERFMLERAVLVEKNGKPEAG
ncbi:FadR/GntR family transcriptional regulator [Rhizobium halophytocola]|uniref:DNA-binding FadR family transcriptional regulator n=1 Tax=Rhizobium halophytocola TaxID=735519 RepID=A0ABS4DSW4_9HYPH|nr:FCD domain-containing protein [Rhizobium halophytocola]MBP1848781.1 DNA-binding FadR family transcriptional regulator [Rhizobium halophytocola]